MGDDWLTDWLSEWLIDLLIDRSIVWLFIRIYLLALGDATFLQVQAIVGDRARLPCEAGELKEVDWKYTNASRPSEQQVWHRKDIVNGYFQRFSIETKAIGSYNLVIFPVQLNDSGIYECIEDGGFGKVHRIRLTVKLGKSMHLLFVLNAEKNLLASKENSD